MVCKLVELDGAPIIKLSSDKNKMTLPGSKVAYRVFLAKPTEDQVCFDLLGTDEDDMEQLSEQKIKIYDLTDNYKEHEVDLSDDNIFLLNNPVFLDGDIIPGNEFDAQVSLPSKKLQFNTHQSIKTFVNSQKAKFDSLLRNKNLQIKVFATESLNRSLNALIEKLSVKAN